MCQVGPQSETFLISVVQSCSYGDGSGVHTGELCCVLLLSLRGLIVAACFFIFFLPPAAFFAL